VILVAGFLLTTIALGNSADFGEDENIDPWLLLYPGLILTAVGVVLSITLTGSFW